MFMRVAGTTSKTANKTLTISQFQLVGIPLMGQFPITRVISMGRRNTNPEPA
jgi:hypothetical protein